MKRNLKWVAMVLFVILIVAVGWVATLFHPLPNGEYGEKADQLAGNILSALNFEKYNKIEGLSWTFRGVNHYDWNKKNRTVRVNWDSNEVVLNFKTGKHVIINNEEDIPDDEIIKKAIGYFYNDSFWLVAPFKIMDAGVERQFIDWENGYALRVTFTSGGNAPGDSYLWILDEGYRPIAWRLWTSNVPIKGMQFEWADWQQHNDVWFAPNHPGPGPLSIDITNLRVY